MDEVVKNGEKKKQKTKLELMKKGINIKKRGIKHKQMKQTKKRQREGLREGENNIKKFE